MSSPPKRKRKTGRASQRSAASTPSRKTVHLVKLAVGIRDVEHLATLQRQRRAAMRKAGKRPLSRHFTRNRPRRADEIVAGGSIYWVIRGAIRVRQRILAIKPGVNAEGASRAEIQLHSALVRVAPRPLRAFQGWRYLEAVDAPPDLVDLGGDLAEMPAKMAEELRVLGLL